MLLSRNKTIFWDYIKNTKDRMKQFDINNPNIPDSLKPELAKICDKISSELTDMRILLTQPEIKSMDEWNDKKQNIAILQGQIADKIKLAIMSNHAPINTK